MDMRIPPLGIKTLLESSPPKSRILVRRLARAPLRTQSAVMKLRGKYFKDNEDFHSKKEVQDMKEKHFKALLLSCTDGSVG